MGEQQLIEEFKTRWFEGDYEAKDILIKLKKDGYVLSEDLHRIYESCNIGYGRSESFNEILAQIRVNIHKGNLERALEEINKAIKEESNFFTLQMIKGVILYKMEKPDEAFKYLNLAFTLCPSHPSTSFNLAIYYCSEKMKPEMMRMLRLALKMGWEKTCSDYRESIKEEKIFDTYRNDEDFKEAFVSKYPSPLCEKIMNQILNESEDGLKSIVENIDDELPHEEMNSYDLNEMKVYIYYLILNDLDEHGEIHLDYYEDFEENTIPYFKRKLNEALQQLKADKKTNTNSSLEVGIGKSNYMSFLSYLDITYIKGV